MGDSTKTIPEYVKNNSDKKFDLIFIDGGHDYEIAKADVDNCFHLAYENTIVILDDTIFTNGWQVPCAIGPTRVWVENVQQHKIIELNKKDYRTGRGMSWEKYVL